MKRVLVRWLDIESEDAWSDPKDIDRWVQTPFPEARTAGWIVYESDDRIAVCSSYFPDGEWGHVTRIPKCVVQSVTEI